MDTADSPRQELDRVSAHGQPGRRLHHIGARTRIAQRSDDAVMAAIDGFVLVALLVLTPVAALAGALVEAAEMVWGTVRLVALGAGWLGTSLIKGVGPLLHAHERPETAATSPTPTTPVVAWPLPSEVGGVDARGRAALAAARVAARPSFQHDLTSARQQVRTPDRDRGGLA